MAQLSSRGAALAALRLWRKQRRFANAIISELLAKTDLATSDRAFAFELFYGVLRNLTLLDFWIDCMRASPVESELRDILRLGMYQLFCLNSAEHAAVHETVQLAPKRLRSVANAVLRGATRQRSELIARADSQPLFIRTSHPQFLVDRWRQHFSETAAEGLCRWNDLPAPLYARINLLKIDRNEFLQRYPESRPLPNDLNFVEFGSLPSVALDQGHCYMQDLSTSIACNLLGPRPREKILDACAAPGGKTSYLAQSMQNQGTIVACDRDPQRVEILKANMARLGVGIVQTVQHDWRRSDVPSDIAAAGPFDRILLDAPCSNTGVMRRRVDVKWRLQPADFDRMQRQQIEILRSLVPLLKPNGMLVYSTCSLEPEENEQVRQWLLAEMPIFCLEAERHSLPFRDGFDGAFAAKLVRSA
jgi:16S rRNA (cytosine967-C5)-methyltransferase